MKHKIAPSILSGDFAQLGLECKSLIEAGADWLHVDIMDGHFVPNLTIGPPVVKSIRKHTNAFLDCHCMVSDPDRWIEDLAKAGANQVTFHYEASKDVEQTIENIRKAGMRVGIAIKPDTSINAVLPFLDRIDMVLIMTVEPGFGGQSIILDCLDKVRRVRDLNGDIDVQVDGGITLGNLPQVIEAGANVIVAGTLIFGAPTMGEMMSKIKSMFNQYQKD